MSKRNVLIFTVSYFILNAVVFYLVDNDTLRMYGSYNVFLSKIMSIGRYTDSYIIESIGYLTLSSLVFYILACYAAKKYEVILLSLIACVVSIPYINFSGL